jgi:hypothetical protein
MAKRKVKRKTMNATKTKDFRELILAELERTNRSRYWLAHAVADDQASNVNERAVYRYLSGEGDTTGAVLASAFAVLGIRVTLPT